MNNQKVYAAGVVIFRVQDGTVQYLLLHSMKGHWDFAKGRLDAGETVEQAAVRELHEEAGLTVDAVDAEFQAMVSYPVEYDGKKYTKEIIYFLGRADNQQVRISHEHDAFVWLTLADALLLLTHHESKELLTQADARVRLRQGD